MDASHGTSRLQLAGDGRGDRRVYPQGAGDGAGAGAGAGAGSHLSKPEGAHEFKDLENTATTVKTHHKYAYAIVLANEVKPNGLTRHELRKLQQKILEFLARSGLNLYLLCEDEKKDTDGMLVVLVEGLTDEQLEEEVERQRVELFFESGTLEPMTAQNMTVAQRLTQLHVVVSRALSRVRDNGHLFRKIQDERSELQWERDVVALQGPLHDLEFNDKFFKQLSQRESCVSLHMDHQLVEIRKHFGERVAFYFFFVSYYTKWLAPLALFMTLFYIIVRIAHWPSYERGLAVVGLAVPTIWAPLMAINWKRKSAQLRHAWKLDQHPVPELPNPHNPDFKMVPNDITKEFERKYDPTNNRAKIKAFTPFFTLCNMILLVAVFVPFIQWYVYSKLVPTCECCEWYMDAGKNLTAIDPPLPSECTIFQEEALINYEKGTFFEPSSCKYFMTCFNAVGGTIGTDRWVYILFQGIIVGLVMDVVQFELFAWVMEKFTQLESWGSESLYEQNVIQKQFYFIWLNMFFWFWWIAFVYVPFGEDVQQVLDDIGFGWTVPGFGWRPGVINIDEAFVTPLIATQSINLALETLIPLCVNKKARALHEKKMALRKTLDVESALKYLPDQLAGFVHQTPRETKGEVKPYHTPQSLQIFMKKEWDGKVGILKGFTDDSNRYDPVQVIVQLQRSPWHPRIDYLDIMMQFGYVCQFTTCWALAPVPAIVNNVLEVRGDVLKMMVGHSRPVPVLEKGIGEWENIVDVAIYLSTFTSIGLICLSTGELEYWVFPNCIGNSRLADEQLMGPDLSCFPSWGWRLLAGVAIFFVSSFIKNQLKVNIPAIDPKLAHKVRSHAALVRRERQRKLLPQMPEDFLKDLRTLFDSYDVSGDKVLGHDECGQMFGSINKLAHRLDNNVRELTDADKESLFEVLDADNSKSISFKEAALAVSRCQADPFLRDAIGFNLAAATRELAEGMSRLRQRRSQRGELTTSRRDIADEAARIIAASTNDIQQDSFRVNGDAPSSPPLPPRASPTRPALIAQ